MKKEIFKFQRSQFSTQGKGILVYNKNKSIYYQQFGDEIINLTAKLFGENEKIYVSGYLNNKKELIITGIEMEQDW